jgi:hypothetical protein
MLNKIFLPFWTLSIGYKTALSLFCEPILDTNQLSITGVIDLVSPTALNGVITVKSEKIPYGGVLEFLTDREKSQGENGRYKHRDREDYDALLMIKFTKDGVIFSSRLRGHYFGETSFQINETESESLTLQLLGLLVSLSLINICSHEMGPRLCINKLLQLIVIKIISLF